ncbi:MAG: GGDEF domain-containing protein [Sulfuricurvum sp.]|jgi:diguanylate cyclase (GGDEF)-like protein|uniref:GGDEF domain-containing protein n=1 Tax=Sulfuricurvum sp. TaxID=2025608 RepID=UPI0025E5F95A|nr:GGDEF domain-containing protein [Sulfuricurvum sp.]MCK9372880.1 GGDEF domain-containing protein [Sulfuricurvum sp.]
MNTNRKILFIVALMLIGLAVATITNVALNFREYGYNNAIEKSKMTAEIVRDGLTAHMVNGIMDKRQFFLSNIANIKDVQALWIVRADKVVNQHGEGLDNERPRDAIDRKVLKEGVIIREIQEDTRNAVLRVTIPYIATAYGSPNCLSCHNAKEGDVLGAISMEFNINEIRQTGAITIGKIFAINLVFLIIALWVTNHYFKPYMQLFENLQQGIKRARTGDFSFRFKTTLKDAGSEVAEQMNTLFEKMEETFGGIKHNLNTFVSRSNISCTDPLNSAGTIIKELSDVYKFKKTIELDSSKDAIYARFIYVLQEKFHFSHFALYEVDKTVKERKLIYITDHKSFCLPAADTNPTECRAYRTNSDVYSTDFPNLCNHCDNTKEYTCIPFNINDDLSLILSYSANGIEEIENMNLALPSIKNYFEAAKAVIESRTLMDKLRDSSLRDGATRLYNRRFLEEFIDRSAAQALRSNVSYAVLMIDIDFFKMVNDTYGHDAGDLVIKSLAEILQHSIRKSDLPIRYGGEEFLVLLHNTTQEGALAIAEKIRTVFNEKKFQFGSDSLQKTLSIGISHFPLHADSLWKVIKFADIALYEGKHTGRNRVIEFEERMFNGGDQF